MTALPRRWALSLVVAWSLLWHLKGITAPPLDYHYHRQVNTAAIARNYAENGMHFGSPQILWAGPYRGRTATEFPLYMWLTALLWPLLGLGAAWGRLLSVACSALGAAYLYLFLERRLSAREALASALLFACIPVELYFGRTIQPEALALAATVAAFYHWDRFLDDESLGQWALAVLAAFLAIGHKLPYGYALLVLAALTWSRRGAAFLFKPAVLAAPAVCLAAVFAWYRYASVGPYVVPSHAGDFAGLLTYKLFYVQFQFLSRLPELGATWAGMFLAVAGARLLWLRGARFFHAWWAAVAFSIILGGAYTFYHEYTSLPYAPIMAAFMGAGLVALWDAAGRAARPAASRAALLAVAALVPVLGTYRIKHWYNQNFPYLANAEAAAAKVSTDDDLFLCNERASSVVLYYLKRHGWSFELNEHGATALPEVESYIAKGARFYATGRDHLTPEHAAWFDARFPKVYDDGALVIYKLQPPAGLAKRR